MKLTNREYSHFLQYLIALAAACLVFGIMQGTKDNYGVMMNGIVEHTKISYASVSFAIGIGQILYGVTQPIFAMVALRKSNAFVLFCGIILMAAGLIVTPFCTEAWSMFLFFGIILPTGTGALCIGHQIGAFASAWLGGILVNTSLSYTALWVADLCLCSTASFVSFHIKD